MWKGCPIPQMKTPEFPPSPASSFWSRMMYWNTSFILAKQLKSLLLWSDATDCKGASQFCPDRVRGAPAFPGAQGKKKKKKCILIRKSTKEAAWTEDDFERKYAWLTFWSVIWISLLLYAGYASEICESGIQDTENRGIWRMQEKLRF